MTYFTAINRLHDIRLVNEALSAINWKGISSVDHNQIAGLRNILAIHQGMICAGCGESLIGQRVELCHIVSAPYGKGVVAGNVYAGCKECNDYDRRACKGNAEMIIDRMVRPDLIALSHPDRPACIAAKGNERKDIVNAKRDAMAAY